MLLVYIYVKRNRLLYPRITGRDETGPNRVLLQRLISRERKGPLAMGRFTVEDYLRKDEGVVDYILRCCRE